MKKINLPLLIVSFFAITFTTNLFGFSGHISQVNTEQMAAIKNLTIRQFVNLSATEYSSITGKKMNMLQRFSFSIMKIKMKHELKKNPNLTLKTYIDEAKTKHRMGTGWWILIGAVGVLVLLLIVGLILYGGAIM